MAVSKFTEKTCSRFVELVRGGATTEEAARVLGVRFQTAKNWLRRGRREGEGAYAEFTAAVEAARGEARESKQAVMSREEFEAHLALAVRRGSSQAMKLWWEIHRSSDDGDAVPGDAFDELDELAPRREARAG